MRLWITLALCPFALWAQEPELITDRPDQTESAVAVPRGTVQIEFGGLLVSNEAAGVEVEVTALGALARFGVSERFELRLGWGAEVSVDVDTPLGPVAASSGLEDGALGAKFELAEERGRRPQMALLVESTLPVGDDQQTSNRFDPSFRFAFTHSLSDVVGFSYNLGAAWATETDAAGRKETRARAIYTAVAGFSLGERTAAFIEIFGALPTDSAAGDAAHSFDGGFTYLVTPRVQLDLSAGVGLSEAAEDWFVGLGISFRVPR